MPFEVERKSNGSVTRDNFEKALLDRMMDSLAGWDRTFAMVTLGLMFISRSLTDVAKAINQHTMSMNRGRR